MSPVISLLLGQDGYILMAFILGLTALNMMLFSLLHYPSGTTLFNIYKETKSKKWTFLAFLIPTVISILVPLIITQTVRFLDGFKF